MKTISTLFLALVLTGWSVDLRAQEVGVEVLRGEFLTLMEMLPGTFDNFEQVQRQEEVDLPRDGWNGRAHHAVMRVDIPSLGSDVFFSRSNLNDDADDIYRQVISSYAIDAKAGAIRERQYRIMRPIRVYGERPYSSDLSGLNVDDLEYQAGCDFLWRFQGDRFVATLDVAPCVFRETSGLVFVRDYYVLDSRTMWRTEKWTDENGRLVMGNALGVPQEARRARWFACEISLNQATDELSYTRRVEVHDQGGSARIYTAAQRMAVGFLRMRRAYVSGRERQAELRLNWHRSASAKPTEFTLRHPDAGEIAVESPDLDAYCIQDMSAPRVPELKPRESRLSGG